MRLTYELAWTWLEERGGGLYSSRQTAEGPWVCSVGGVRGMAEVTCTGHGQRHNDAFVQAVQELQDLSNLMPSQRGPTLP